MQIELSRQPPIMLPDELLNTLGMVHGMRVGTWLGELPGMLQGVLDELDAHVVPGQPLLSFHLVFFARTSRGEDIVVKCTVPNDEQPPEVAGVHALSDAGIGPRLIWSDPGRGVLVMDRVQPGDIMPTTLPSLTDDAATTRAIAGLAAHMARDAGMHRWQDALVPVRHYTRALGEVDTGSTFWRAHHDDVEQAIGMRDALLAAPRDRDVFLHGDLHHYNVLQSGEHALRVIDPKGLTGPAGYEFGAYTYNPVGIQHHTELTAIERQRVDIWSQVTGVPRETVRAWGYVAAVLSACWSAGDGGSGWEGAIRIATTLRDLDRAP